MFRVVSYLKNGDLHDYYLTKKNDNIKLKINNGVLKAKELLDIINNSINDKVYIIIERINEEIKYIIDFSQYDNCELMINGFNFVEDKIDTTNYDNDNILYGGIPIQNFDNMQDSLIERIDSLPSKENFVIKIELRKGQEQVKNGSLNFIKEIIRINQKEATKNISNQDNFALEAYKKFAGAERINYTESDISLENEIKKLESKYILISNSASIYHLPKITISSPCASLNLSIVSIIKALSQKSLLIDPYGIISDSIRYDKNELIPSEYIAGLIALPNKSLRGLSVIKEVHFGVNENELSCDKKEVQYEINENKLLCNRINLGNIVYNKIYNAQSYIDIDDLTKHCLVAGVTGSGKTSTVKSILLQLKEKNIPFLILEPAKTEYRALRNILNELKIYRLGFNDEDSLKINTFEFPIGTHIQTHLDYLKSVFIAAFPMYGPMPYILEQAMYKIYEKYGWDFISGENIYDNKVERYLLFPTLEDLYDAIDYVTDDIGYSNDTQSDVKGALKVRIGSLINGAKGRVLNTWDYTNIESILKQPTVIELEHIGDNQEKVFLMGMILIKIYEYYRSKGVHIDKLKNLLVIEEAHRLLTNVPEINNNEIADMKGKSLELFNEVLSEVRTYGQGVLVAEQIPSKISSDVLKNTNLKIVHRIFSEDDRQVLGKSIGLDDEQINEIVKLKTGEAIIFHDNLTEPMRTKFEKDEKLSLNNYNTELNNKPKPYDSYDYILNNKSFLKKSNNLIISFLIKQDKNEFLKYLSKLIDNEKIYIGESTIDIELLGKKVLLKYIKSLEYGLMFNNLIDKNNINIETDLFDFCINRMKKNLCDIEYKKPIDDLSKYSTAIRVLNLFNMLKIENINFDFNNFNQNNKNTNLILKKLGLDNFINLSMFNDNELAILCDSIILNLIENNKIYLNKYFQIGEINPNNINIFHKELTKINEAKEEKVGYSDEDKKNMKELFNDEFEIRFNKLFTVNESITRIFKLIKNVNISIYLLIITQILSLIFLAVWLFVSLY